MITNSIRIDFFSNYINNRLQNIVFLPKTNEKKKKEISKQKQRLISTFHKIYQ